MLNLTQAALILERAVSSEADQLARLYRFEISSKSLAALERLVEPEERAAFAQLRSDASCYDKTLWLRKGLERILKRAPSQKRLALARWVITDWGQIDKEPRSGSPGLTAKRTERAEALEQLIARAESWIDGTFPTAGDYSTIARWSKYLAFRFPDKAAIYDSRVVYSLNWYLRTAVDCPLFPSLTARNTLLDLFDHRLLVLAARLGWDRVETTVRADVVKLEHGEDRRSRALRRLSKETSVVSKRSAYRIYCELLRQLANRLYPDDPWGLTQCEMLLFSLATSRVVPEVLGALRRPAMPAGA